MATILESIEKYKRRFKLMKSFASRIIQKDVDLESRLDITKHLKFNNYNEIVEEFNNIFENTFEPSCKINFNKNIKKLKIKEMKDNSLLNPLYKKEGSYQPNRNLIEVKSNDVEDEIELKSILMHELLHMSSKKNDDIFNGLKYSIKRNDGFIVLGNGLNEGYTELLNQKYFSKKVDDHHYICEKVLAAGFERLVGKEKMQKYYFTSNVLELVEDLKEYYGSTKEPMELIFEIDKCVEEFDTKLRKKEFNTVKKEIARLMKTKLDNQLNSGLIDVEEYERKMFLDVELYNKKDFIYNEIPKIIEEDNCYKINGDLGNTKISKDEIKYLVSPDETINNNTK